MNVILNLFDAFISETDIPEYALRHSTTPTKGKYEYGKRKERALTMVCAYSLPCAIAAIPSIKPYASTELPQTPVHTTYGEATTPRVIVCISTSTTFTLSVCSVTPSQCWQS